MKIKIMRKRVKKMKLLKKKPKLIIEFEEAEDRSGFFLSVKTEGDMCDKYIIAAADYLNKGIKACKKGKTNGKNGGK